MKDAAFSCARLLALYDRISDAEDAIPRLRRLVLDLAVRGKLVEQDASDEPAAELLKRIASERERLVREKAIKKPQLLEPIKDHPFNVPSNWNWCRLGGVAELVRGVSFSASDKSNVPGDELLPCFRSGNIQSETIWGDFIYVPKTVLRNEQQLVQTGDVLISIANSYALVGKCSIVRDLPYAATFGAFLAAIRLHFIAPEYAKVFLSSEHSTEAFSVGSSQTTNIANITFSTIRDHLFPLPPLAEQHRIVAKVDELMALCDQLEQARAGREAARDRLTTASLARLTAPETDAESLPAEVGPGFASGNATNTSAFQSHARFALQSLPTLTTRPDQIKTLRHTILNLAVRGKLVEQDTADEPAAALLKRIEAQTAARLAGGRAQKMIELVAVSADEQDFEIPETWLWTRLGSVIKLWNGFAFKSSDFKTTGTPVIRIGDLTDGEVKLSSSVHVSSEVANSVSDDVWIPEDALLLAMSGATTGKTAFNRTGQKLLLNQRVGRIETFSMNINFIRFFFETIIVRNLSISLGTAIPNLSTKQINETAIPLPPLAEQHRIVAKVDALMALCDQLEASLTTATTTRSKLLNVLLHEALAPGAAELEVEQ